MPEPDDKQNDSARSFWVTAPGVITAVGGLLTAIAVLIGALNAAGVIGGTTDSPSSSGTSVTPTNPSDSDGVLHGDWLVNLKIRRVDGPGSIYTNKLWGLEPTVGAHSQEHWTLESICPESPCETRWDSVETPDRFATLKFENGTYADTDTGSAACPGGAVPVQRSIVLHVTDAHDVEGVWSGIVISGQIESSWTCGGQRVGGVLDVDGSRVLP
jgi:hypothetical protein